MSNSYVLLHSRRHLRPGWKPQKKSKRATKDIKKFLYSNHTGDTYLGRAQLKTGGHISSLQAFSSETLSLLRSLESDIHQVRAVFAAARNPPTTKTCPGCERNGSHFRKRKNPSLHSRVQRPGTQFFFFRTQMKSTTALPQSGHAS